MYTDGWTSDGFTVGNPLFSSRSSTGLGINLAVSNNRIVAIEQDITDISNNRIVAIEDDIFDISNNRIVAKLDGYGRETKRPVIGYGQRADNGQRADSRVKDSIEPDALRA